MTYLLYYLKGNSLIAISSISLIAFSSMAMINGVKSNLYSFKVAQIEQHTHLSWVAFSENANQVFTLERSMDEVSFEVIATIQAEEEFEVPVSYHHNDESVKVGTKYAYRLKYVNKDGEEAYSSIVPILVAHHPVMAGTGKRIN